MAKKDFVFRKAIGGDFGVWWQKGKWHRFECLGCMYASGILNPLDKEAGTLPQKFASMSVEQRHDVKLHGDWLRAGKPYDKRR